MKIPLADNIYWVGAVDWNVRDFHGYTTTRGSTYNAYLIVDEKIALVDSVKNPFVADLMQNVAEHVDPAKIDYVVSNHSEPDHSGSLYAMLEAAPHAQLIASPKGASTLEAYYGEARQVRAVKTGDEIPLGKRTLRFVTTPMLHWPDSMFTYVPEEKLLFSMDGFGQHLATSGRFDEDAPFDVIMAEAKKYYANILMHLGRIVARTLDQARDMEIETIAPSHGIIWRKHIPDILSAYAAWAECRPAAKVLVMYDTMWNSTEAMARAIHEGVTAQSVECKLLKISKNDLTDLTTEVLDAACLAVGSPTLNNGMLPSVASMLTYITGLKPAGKVGVAFGSHGWSGGGATQVADMLDKASVALIREPLTTVFKPSDAVLDECREAGASLAEKARELVQSL